MAAILQVSQSRYYDSVCSSTPPELHQQSVPQIRCRFEFELMHNQLPVTTKWKRILNVYQWDKQNNVHLIYKLTDAHLFLVAQDAIKVSLAAQVMSHTVRTSQKHCRFSRQGTLLCLHCVVIRSKVIYMNLTYF
jgi:hypothetical protein